MINLAVGRGPSPRSVSECKIRHKKKHPVAVQQNANDLPTFCQKCYSFITLERLNSLSNAKATLRNCRNTTSSFLLYLTLSMCVASSPINDCVGKRPITTADNHYLFRW